MRNVLKCRQEINRLWFTNSNEDFKAVKFKKTESCKVNSVVFNQFSSIRAKNIPVSELLTPEQSRKVAKSLDIAEFKASNGCLGKFQKRNTIPSKIIFGEKISVDIKTITKQKDKLIEVCKVYESRNVLCFTKQNYELQR